MPTSDVALDFASFLPSKVLGCYGGRACAAKGDARAQTRRQACVHGQRAGHASPRAGRDGRMGPNGVSGSNARRRAGV